MARVLAVNKALASAKDSGAEGKKTGMFHGKGSLLWSLPEGMTAA